MRIDTPNSKQHQSYQNQSIQWTTRQTSATTTAQYLSRKHWNMNGFGGSKNDLGNIVRIEEWHEILRAELIWAILIVSFVLHWCRILMVLWNWDTSSTCASLKRIIWIGSSLIESFLFPAIQISCICFGRLWIPRFVYRASAVRMSRHYSEVKSYDLICFFLSFFFI